jgi:anti-sigma B factor antagonist
MSGEAREIGLQIQSSLRSGGYLIALHGEVDLHSSPKLRQTLLDVLEQNPTQHIVIDLTGVSYMDSSGVGTLVELKRKSERRKGRVTLVGPQPRVRSVFEITQLDKFFQIVESLADAGVK